MAKILISLSVLFLTLSAVFGVLNTNKARELRQAAERSHVGTPPPVAHEKEHQTPVATVADANATSAAIERAEAELVKSQTEKADLQTKLQAKQDELAAAQKRLVETSPKEVIPDTLPMPGEDDLQKQLEDTRRQLDNAEREKQLLASKIRTSQDRSTTTEAPRKRTLTTAPRNPGLRGTVLAVNQAYNFVVLNLGGRQGVEANSEMLVLRAAPSSAKSASLQLNPPPPSAILSPAAWRVAFRCNPEILLFMLALIRKFPLASERLTSRFVVRRCISLVSAPPKRNHRSSTTGRRKRNQPCLGINRRNGRHTDQRLAQ